MNQQKVITRSLRSQDRPRLVRLVCSPYRSLLPLFMRRLGWSRQTDVITFWGGRFSGLLPEAVSTQIWRHKIYEPRVTSVLQRLLKPGDTFVDVGAHFGYFSLLASQLVGATGHVVAIEAMPSTYLRLADNIAKNAPFDNVIAVESAAFDEQAMLQFTDYGPIASSLNGAFEIRGHVQGIRSKPETVQVSADLCDAILQRLDRSRPNLVKIDAESAEIHVLRGLRQTLSTARPRVIVEVGDEGVGAERSSAAIFELMSEMGYQPFSVDDEGLLSAYVPKSAIVYENIVFSTTD
jgi:FkbM family methyltransferase